MGHCTEGPDPGSIWLTPFEPVNAHRQFRDLATQLVRLVSPSAHTAQLEPDVRDLAGNEVSQEYDLILEARNPIGEHVHPIAQSPDFNAQFCELATQLHELATQFRELATQLHVLRLLQLDKAVNAGEASVRAGRASVHVADDSVDASVHAGEARLHHLAQCREGGARFGIHSLEDSLPSRAIP